LWYLGAGFLVAAPTALAVVDDSYVSRSGLQLWLRADSLSLANGAAVSQWADQSGHGNTASQTVIAKQPTYTAGVAGTYKGMPMVHFNSGATQYLSVANATGLNPSQITIIAVARRNTGTGTVMIAAKETGTTGYSLRFTSATAVNGYINNAQAAPGVIATGSLALIDQTYDQVQNLLYVNGSAGTGNAYAAAIASNTNALTIGSKGSSNPLNGDIAEMLIYDHALNDEDRKAIEAYVNEKYGVGVKPAASSPLFSLPTGTYTSTQGITLSSPSGGTIYYTLDGSTPTVNSTLYTGAITISQTTTLKAIAVKDGYNNSSVWQETISIDPSTGYIPRNDLRVWLRADSITQSNGTAVANWSDQSGNSNDAIQNTAGNQPIFHTSVLNGRPVVTFTGGTAKNHLSIADDSSLSVTRVSMIAVIRRSSGTGVAVVAEKYTAGTGPGYSLRMQTVTTARSIINSNNATTNANANPISLNSFVLLASVYDQAANAVFVNGAAAASNSYTTAINTPAGSLYVGGQPTQNSFDGDIAELLIYGRGLTVAERHNIEAYIYFKYGVGPAVAPTVTLLSGDQQTGLINQFNAAPFYVAVWNSAGTAPLVGKSVAFNVTSGGGQLSATHDANATLSTSLNLTTDAYGTVNAYYKQGGTPSVTSYIQAASGGASVQITTYSMADTTAPSVPAGLSASNLAATSFTLNWSASTDNVGVTGYDIFKNSTLLGSSTTTNYAVTGLVPLTAYGMTVKAKDAVGNVSAASGTLSVTTTADTTAPSVPVILSVSNLEATGFTLAWAASTDNVQVTGYDVYRDGVLAGSTATTNYTVTGLAPTTAYTMTVKAKDAAGNASAASAPRSVTTGPDTAAPSMPTALTAGNLTATGFTLTWAESIDNVWVAGYDIYKNGTFLGSSATTSYAVTGLVPQSTYVMTVKAKDAANNMSTASGGLSVTTTADTTPPTAPTGLESSSITATSFTLSWSASTDNVLVTGYDIFKNGTQIGSSATTSYAVTGLAPTTAYNMTVKAKDAAGNISVASSVLSVTTTPDTTVPAAPTDLIASSIATTGFTLSWTASSDNVGVTGYDIYKDGVLLDSTTTEPSYAVTGLASSTTYSMTVKAKDGAGNISGASDALAVTTAQLLPGDPLDYDTDGLPDYWEMVYFGNLNQTPTGNPDGDDLDNQAERIAGSNPNGQASTVAPSVMALVIYSP
jgi:chitodextrinase